MIWCCQQTEFGSVVIGEVSESGGADEEDRRGHTHRRIKPHVRSARYPVDGCNAPEHYAGMRFDHHGAELVGEGR